MIKLNKILKRFDSTVVFDDRSFVINDGERVAIMGKSGCGKTTLLRIIAGLEPLDAGTVEGFSPEDIAVIFQEARLFPQLTVLENLTVVSTLPKSDAIALASSLLEKVGLSSSSSLYPSELSGGMAQRVAIARSMMTNTPILLMDEPFSALDEETRLHMIELVREYANGKTLLFVTHSDEDAKLLADRVIEL